MFICTGNGAISFNSQNHENVLSILSSLLELHLRFCREVNLLWRTLNAVHPLPARQCEQPEPVHEIHRTQASRQWNEGHSAETTDQMLPWYTFTMVHLILSKPLWWQRERRVSAYVPMYFFFFFQGCENTYWKTKKSPTNPRISSFFESQDQESLWSISCISKQKQNKNLQQICLTRVETENSLSFLKRGLTDLSPFGAIQKQLLHLTSNTML